MGFNSGFKGLKYLYHLKRKTYSADCWTDWESYFRKEIVALYPVKGGLQLLIGVCGCAHCNGDL